MTAAFINIYKEEAGLRSLLRLRTEIDRIAAQDGASIDLWVESEYGKKGRKPEIATLLRKMNRGDVLYVEEVSRLGTSLGEILEVLSSALKRGVKVYGIKDGFSFDFVADERSYITALEHIGDIYNNMISSRTRAALQKKKQEGATLGRPVGTCGKKDILLRNRNEIDRDIREGVPYADICRRYKVSYSTFRRFKMENSTKISNTNT